MAITSQKLLPGSTFSNTKVDTENKKTLKKTDPSLNIYKKVIKIDKLLKNNFLIKSKEENRKIREEENQKRENKEKELESPKNFKGFQILKNALPKTGFLDSIKRFILFTFAGWLFTNLFKFLPKLLGFLKLLKPVISWFEKGIGLLLEGIVSFIDFGYKAYDTVRSFVETIGGEGLLEKFDALSGTLNTFLNLALIAGMSAASLGGGGLGGKPGPGGRPTPGTGGRPRVTTSGGGGVGRPDIRNPLRQGPTVTTSGGGRAGRPDIRNPLRQGPRVTASGGSASKGLGKVAGKGLGKFAGKLPFVGPLIDFGIRRFVFKEPLGRAAAGAVGVAAGQALGGWLGGSLGGIVGSVVPVAGTLLGAGGGALIGNIAGGFIGDWIGTSLYDFIAASGDTETRKMSSGGKVSPKTSAKRKKESKFKLKRQPPGKIILGKDIGGEKQIEKIYPNPDRKFFGLFNIGEGFSWGNILFGKKKDKKIKRKERKKIPNAIKTLLGVGDALGKSGDWISTLLRAPIEVALGKKPDVKSISKIISSVLQNVTDPAIKGIKSITRELFGFADGGEVSRISESIISSSESVKLERNIELNLRTKFDDAFKVVKTESRKKGGKFGEDSKDTEPPIAGRDEMLQENIKKGKNKESQFTVTGGNADFWTLVAIASREDGDPQAWADVAQSIYNRVASGVYGAKTIQGIVTREGQYEPTWKYPYYGTKGKPNKEWFSIKDAETASKATGMSVSAMNSVAAAIRNVNYQKEAATFVGGRTDFMGGSNKPGPGDVRRKENSPNNFFGWFVGPAAKAYGSKNPGPAVTPQLGDISVMETKPKEEKGEFSLFKPSTWFSGKDKKKEESEGSGGKLGGKGNFIQGNSGNSRGVHFHIGPGKQTEGTILQSKYNADARASATKVVDYFLKKGSKIYDGRRGVYYKSAKEVAAAQKAHTASGSQGGIDLQVDFETPHKFPLSTFGMKYRKNGFGVSADITGSNSFVAHGRYDEKGKVAPQESMKLYRGGGLISPSTPNVTIPDSFAPYNDPRKSTTVAYQQIIIEKDNIIPSNSPMYFPSSGSSRVNNSMLPSLMQG